eukprot:586479-Pleurochrysis_carterae.AAC.1
MLTSSSSTRVARELRLTPGPKTADLQRLCSISTSLTITRRGMMSVCDGTHAPHRAAPHRRTAALRTTQRVACR